MLTNTPYLRTGLFLALLFTMAAGFYQVVSFQLDRNDSYDHQYSDNDGHQFRFSDNVLNKGTVELPLFPGCDDGQDYETRRRCARINMSRYLSKHMNKDLLDRKGRVYIRFSVDLAGQLQNARLTQKTDADLAAEVMRLVGLQQGADLRWTPGKIKGTPRAMTVTLQVSFGQRCKGCEDVMVEMVP